jgi:N-methylhydantoinase A/oxoprolinase/acetone carboxylase beta subunit
MNMGLGVDTGGTYTDSVIVNLGTMEVLDKAKALTTREDLALGISDSINRLNSKFLPKIKLVSISTTLATNSIVEGKGCRVGLIVAGHESYPDLPVDAWVEIKGGHRLNGAAMDKLDLEKARSFVLEVKDKVDAFAVSSYLSIRNPEHENTLKNMIEELTSRPVVCGHELSSELGFYERTTTAVLNAKLIPIIEELITSIRKVLFRKKIKAPIMVVKGDGSLMGEKIARQRPIETILSGPAASVIGARFLTNEENAIVIDIGGTTTDIAILRNGRPHLDQEGAIIGGWKTRVKAIDILTSGVGGDSMITLEKNNVILSPRRVIPLCIASNLYPGLNEKLQKAKHRKMLRPPLYVNYKKNRLIHPTDLFVLSKEIEGLGIRDRERRLLEILKKGPHSLYDAGQTLGINPYSFDLDKLLELNVVNQIGLTPTDVLHAEGSYVKYDSEASKLGVETLARILRVETGEFIQEVKKAVINKVTREILTKLVYEQIGRSTVAYCDTCLYLLDNMINGAGREDFACKLKLNKKIIGIGAPAEAYLPEVANKFTTTVVIPYNAEVGNAVGAITGSIVEVIEVLLKPSPGFADIKNPPCIMHSSLERREFQEISEAIDYIVDRYSDECRKRAERSGADSVELKVEREDLYAHVREGYGKKVLLETRITIIAMGKPRLYN